MNILPLKKWHVRRKENVERVRKDEAEAKAKEEELKRRAEIAEREARLDLMKRRARERDGLNSDEEEAVATTTQPTSSSAPKNINFFADLEQGVGSQLTNAEHEAEKKAEQEKVEKRIGLLNYLVDKDKSEQPWYSQAKPAKESAKSKQRKEAMDPMNQMKSYLTKKRKADSLQDQATRPSLLPSPVSSTRPSDPPVTRRAHLTSETCSSEDALHETHKHKKHKKHKQHSKELKKELEAEKKSQLEKLRTERRKREEAERTRAEAMLKTHYGNGKVGVAVNESTSVVERPGRYFSQFNPHLARQHRNDH